MPDTLELPIFDEQYGRFLSACGRLETGSRRVLTRLADVLRKPTIARIGSGRTAEYVELLGGGGKDASNRHLHIDAATASYFSKPPRKPAVSAERLSALVAPFFGEGIRVHVGARFEVPWRELPSDGIVRTTLTDTKGAGVSVRQTGAVYRFGTGEDETRVSFSRRDRLVRVQMDFTVGTTIDRTYMKRLHDLAFDGFRLLILDEEPNDVEPVEARPRAVVRKGRRRAVGRG